MIGSGAPMACPQASTPDGPDVAAVASDALVVRCPVCGVGNRVPRAKIDQGLEPVCGRCKTPLRVDTRPMAVTDASFSKDVERSPLPVLLDAWAAGCGPCRMIAPV